MLTGIDYDSLSFGEPTFLWLLLAPAVLMVLWGWQVLRRRADARRYRQRRLTPVGEHFTMVGDLAFWFCLLLAACCCIVALARPQARTSVVRRASADFVLLQDGSSSMYVTDVKPDRWRRSVQFLRAFAEALSWKGDRVALALFAHLASPQLRLTKDPNSFFFFLDHLSERSPFRLEDLTTWDTNIEEGVYWGVKLVEKDEELFGKTRNPKAFVVVSDGQSWSGNVATALAVARARDIVVHVVGVGTTQGGLIPEGAGPDGIVTRQRILSRHAAAAAEDEQHSRSARPQLPAYDRTCGRWRVLRARSRTRSGRGVSDHQQRSASRPDGPGRDEPGRALLAIPVRGRCHPLSRHLSS